MTRQFHARVRRAPKSTSKPKPRDPRRLSSSFRCYRLVPIDEPGAEPYEIVELCDPRNAMRVLMFER